MRSLCHNLGLALCLCLCLCLGVTLLWSPSLADACDPGDFPSRFELFDDADLVVVGRPTNVPKHAGDVVLAVDTTPKGTAASTIKIPVTASTCDPGFRVGTASIVFLKDGHIIGLYRGAMPIGRQPWAERMKQWAAATDDAARAAVAAAAMTDGGELASEGVIVLLNKPALVAALTADHIATIASAWPKLHSGLRGMLREIKHAELRKALDAVARRRPKVRQK